MCDLINVLQCYSVFRFDPNFIIAIEKIPLTKTALMNYLSFYFAWTIKRVKIGYDDQAEITKTDGTKVKAFNFSGKLDTLPDLRNALETLRSTAAVLETPPLEELVKVKPDEFNIIDLIPYFDRTYVTTPMLFGEFAAYVEETAYRANNRQMIRYTALTLTKKKSEKAMKAARANDKDFFITQTPIRLVYDVVFCMSFTYFLLCAGTWTRSSWVSTLS